MGKALVKLVKKVKKMEDVLKRRHVVLPDSEDEDADISSKQGRNFQEEGLDEMVRNMMKDKLEVFKTLTQSKTLREEDISPTTLEAAKTLSKVASQRSKSVDKGKRYKRRKESKGKDISTGFEDISTGFEDISTGLEDISTGFKEVNTGGLGVSTGSGPVSSARGQREGKAPMIVEETQAPKRTKEQIQQEEASLAEAIRLQTLEEEETAKQVHLDALLAKRMEEEELTEQQKQRKSKLTKNVLGKELPEEDFAKKMVELVNQRKKFFAEERAKARRNREEKGGKVKEEEPVKKVGKRKKQKARKGISIDKSPQGDLENDKRIVESMNPTFFPLDTKLSPSPSPLMRRGLALGLPQQDKHIAVFIKKLFPRMQSSSTYIQVIQSPEQYKWASELLGYDFEVHCKSGKENGVANALSRIEESQLLSLSTPVFPWL
ncbi:hypothetical protein Tco_1111389 [Tanacetum coccineum]|uniref:Uncharacterized protein n=1 Tax=Tanacetum coccineum TaxID=301880 RepID=A0ABQ5ILX8_9ASTR